MKSIVAFLLLVGQFSLSLSAFASSKENPHKLSGNLKGDKNSCQICHPPEKTAINPPLPLWNQSTKVKSFGFGNYAPDMANSNYNNSISKICLSCHDGSRSNSNHSFNLAPKENRKDKVFFIDTTHPVAITYNTELAREDRTLFDPATTPSGLGGTISQDLLKDNKVECTSCHIVHFDNSNNRNFTLITSNTRSNLCLICHNK